MPNIACFGEILWDVFPEKKKIGGAPLNVANRLKSFHHKVAMLSAVGHDALGKQLIDYLNDTGIDTSQVQVLEDFKTGTVQVSLNNKGSASYDIEYPVAWDHIAFKTSQEAWVKNADAFIFGSLVARDQTSRQTLYKLVEQGTFNVFDVNLRPPHYNMAILTHLMEKAHFIKCNDDELYEISKTMGSKFNALEQNISFIAEKTNTPHICVTKGSHGAVLLYNGSLYHNSGYMVDVVDTVGAGDSFLGSLISQLLNGEAPQKAIDFACAVGALVAQSEGANPKISEAEIRRFMNPS